jgi:hypothetical protein
MLSRDEQKRLYKTISRLLWTDWDPIGCGVPEDEYDSYVPAILTMLMSGVDKHRLAEHLYEIETVTMCLQGDMKRDIVVAERLLQLVRPSAT